MIECWAEPIVKNVDLEGSRTVGPLIEQRS